MRPWLYGGRTDLANLVLLCCAHHRGLHLGEFRIVALGGQRFRYLRSDGAELEPRIDPSRLTGTARPLETEYRQVADAAATTRWTGEYLDRDWAVSVLAHRRGRARAAAGSQPRCA